MRTRVATHALAPVCTRVRVCQGWQLQCVPAPECERALHSSSQAEGSLQLQGGKCEQESNDMAISQRV